jgi:outer membrane protein assembly factor BamA
MVYYQRTIDQGYFSLGNASIGSPPANAPPRYFQYLDSELRARQLARIALGPKGYDLVVIGTFRAEAPETYAKSKLAADALEKNADGTPFIRGLNPHGSSELGVAMLGGGLIYDTRDDEVFTHSGTFHQVGLRAVQGLPYEENIQYGAAGANFCWYVPLQHRLLVFATRIAVDLEFGNVPFYDLFTGGPFQTYDMPGGPTGIRGVPSGRYLGRVKALGNAEFRSLPISFHLFHQSFHVGGDVFFDTGRIWVDYTFSSKLDGSGFGLKYGVGGGIYALWGQAAFFRVEAAYSPDQVSENPGFPLGIYVEEGTMF